MDEISFCCCFLCSLSYFVPLVSLSELAVHHFIYLIAVFTQRSYNGSQISCINKISLLRYRSVDHVLGLCLKLSWNEQILIQGQKQQVVDVVNQNYLMES